jgi:hypothetical protein
MHSANLRNFTPRLSGLTQEHLRHTISQSRNLLRSTIAFSKKPL